MLLGVQGEASTGGFLAWETVRGTEGRGGEAAGEAKDRQECKGRTPILRKGRGGVGLGKDRRLRTAWRREKGGQVLGCGGRGGADILTGDRKGAWQLGKSSGSVLGRNPRRGLVRGAARGRGAAVGKDRAPAARAPAWAIGMGQGALGSGFALWEGSAGGDGSRGAWGGQVWAEA